MVFQNDPTTIKRYAPFVKPLDVPTSAIDDAPYVCLRVNEQWIPFILGAVETLRWDDVYKGTPAQIEAATQQVELLFSAIAFGNIECPEDAMIKLRQNSADPCLLEISYDDGDTWLSAFDYSLCGQSETSIDFTVDNSETVYNYITETMIIYDGDITNVYADWGYGDEFDEDRDAVLCWAAKEWIDLVCKMGVAIKNDEANQEKDLLEKTGQVLKEIGGLISFLVTELIFPPYALYAGISFLIAGYGTEAAAYLVSADIAAFMDEEAQEDVACAIYTAMKESTPTFENWSTSLDAHGLTGHAGVIADLAHLYMQEDETYVLYFQMMGPMIGVVKLGLDLGCPCDGDWTHTWLFAVASGSEPHTTYANGAPQWIPDRGGEHSLPGGGWLATEEDLGEVGTERFNLKIAFPSRTITSIRIWAIYHQGFVPIPKMSLPSIIMYVHQAKENAVLVEPFAYQTEGEEDWHWDGIKTGCDFIRIMWRCSYSEADPPFYGEGSIAAYKIVVNGQGNCPF